MQCILYDNFAIVSKLWWFMQWYNTCYD